MTRDELLRQLLTERFGREPDKPPPPPREVIDAIIHDLPPDSRGQP